MGLTRSAVIGLMAWGIMTVMHVKHELAIGVGIFSAFLAESMIQANARSHLRHKATSLQTELNIAIDQICDMKRALDVTTKDLRNALDELHRRDAVGSPAARELLARQEEAMEAQKVALDRSTDRSFETLESLERMIISQGQQTSRVQEVLSMVLEKLALEPRQHINMHDSVLTQENHSTPAMTDDLISLMG
ncbi:MAG: hypothetical protein DWC06_02890 [Candidatus Poseidoniales archaeon]|nr:hypothetical protein [Candidatus Poseidoniales archaeon]RJV01274.1 MAG: hypothetical protein DWC06_02890 [Candidatus Poseidoniales archaeon]